MFFKQPDEKKFDSFFHEKKFFVKSIVDIYVDKPDICDDIIQQVFLKIYLKFSKISEMKYQNSYIHRITVNEVMNHFRKNSSIPMDYNVSNMSELIDSKNFPAEEILSAEDLCLKFNKAVVKFPKKRRNVIVMKLIGDKSYTEISDVLGISEASARNLFSMGMKKLKKILIPETEEV